MAKGDGSVLAVKTPEGDVIKNRWRVMVDMGVNPQTGKRQRAVRIVNGCKRDALRVRDELKRQRDTAEALENRTIRFNELADMWLKSRKMSSSLSDDTKAEDERMLECMKKRFGATRVCEIGPLAVEAYYFSLLDGSGSISGRPLSDSRVLQYHHRLSMVMEYAVNHDFIARNPCRRAAKPSCKSSNRRSLTRDEYARMSTCVDLALEAAYEDYGRKERRAALSNGVGERSYLCGLNEISRLVMLRILLASGMRRGEALALRWGDVSFPEGSIHISHSLRHGKLKAPKTRAGIRTICVDDGTLMCLRKWKDFQVAALGTLRPIDEAQSLPVVCSASGGFSDADKINRWWRSWSAAHGFEGWKLHELRHSHASLLLDAGSSIKEIQLRLGHSSSNITLDIYVHCQPESSRKSANLTGAIMSGACCDAL